MENSKKEGIIEAILFAAGKEVATSELMAALEASEDEIKMLINNLDQEYQKDNRGIEIIRVNDGYQLATKKDMYEYLYSIFDKRNKPNLSQAALETLSIIAYNPKITRAEIETIRGVNSDGTIYKLLEYDLIEAVGKLDAPGRPTMYSVTTNFLKLFGIKNLDELPDLPRYKLDENQQIVIDDLLDNKENSDSEETEAEAPMPEREENEDIK